MLNDAQAEHVDTVGPPDDKSIIEASVSKTSSKGIILIPQPSDNPKDPLVGALAIWFGAVSPVNRVSNRIGRQRRNCCPLLLYVEQLLQGLCKDWPTHRVSFLRLYCTERRQLKYHTVYTRILRLSRCPRLTSVQVSSAIAGLAVGPLVWGPLSKKIGKCSCIFCGILLTLCFNIWSALMTTSGDYNAFVVSRLFAGLAGSAPTTCQYKTDAWLWVNELLSPIY